MTTDAAAGQVLQQCQRAAQLGPKLLAALPVDRRVTPAVSADLMSLLGDAPHPLRLLARRDAQHEEGRPHAGAGEPLQDEF